MNSAPSVSPDIRLLINLPNAEFLPQAFSTLLGREPDAAGLIHYANRLNQKAPRILVLAELACSGEARMHHGGSRSRAFRSLCARYKFIRAWPLGRFRWLVLPHFDASDVPEANFDWTRWAGNWLQEQAVRRARETASGKNGLRHHAEGQSSESQPCLWCQETLARVAVALQGVAHDLQASGLHPGIAEPLERVAEELHYEDLGVNTVPWQARQWICRLHDTLGR